jgi:hypothetical protein
MSEGLAGKRAKAQPSAAPTEMGVGAAEGCDLLILGFVTEQGTSLLVLATCQFLQVTPICIDS